jgi:trehalose 6-phosphate phosphatase
VVDGLPAGLEAALARLARVPELLVALDFDGTLAPIVDLPGEARALPRARAAILRLLDAPGTRVAVVSGRALDSLDAVAGLPETVDLVGSHGVEFRLGGSRTTVLLTQAESELLDRLHGVIGQVTFGIEGVWLESKPAGFAMHTRLASEAAGTFAVREALKRSAQVPGVTVRHGAQVLEFSVRSATKGDAIDRLRQHTAGAPALFAGDDVTDEDVFAVLGPEDVGLKVGPGPTLAAFRVQAPADVARALEVLADLRG